jgi:hypothetical protein
MLKIFSSNQETYKLPYISVTIVLLHWISVSDTHNINAQKFFKESRNLIGTAILYADIDGPKTMYRPVAPVYNTVFGPVLSSISASPSVSWNSESHMESVQPIKCMLFILICNNSIYIFSARERNRTDFKETF